MITVNDLGTSVEVRFENDGGGVAFAIVVGENKESVDARANEIVENHNLKEKATSDSDRK